MIWVDIYEDISIWWERSMKYLKKVQRFSARSGNHRSQTFMIGSWCECLSYKASEHLSVAELFCNLRLPKLHRSMECLWDIIKPCWTWWDHNCHYFWVLCFRDYRFSLNRAPSWSVEMTPYELWHGYKP